MVTSLSLVANFIGTAVTAGVVTVAYFDIHYFKYEPEVYPIEFLNPVSESIVRDVVLYKEVDKIKLSEKQLRCLEYNIYYEAGVEDYAGKIAVAQVTFNRLKTKRWGNSVCKVVYSPHQFSWTKQNKSKPKGKLWKDSKQAAQDYLNGLRILNLQHSLYYHATWMKKEPFWANHKTKVHEIGQHAFYKP